MRCLGSPHHLPPAPRHPARRRPLMTAVYRVVLRPGPAHAITSFAFGGLGWLVGVATHQPSPFAFAFFGGAILGALGMFLLPLFRRRRALGLVVLAVLLALSAYAVVAQLQA